MFGLTLSRTMATTTIEYSFCVTFNLKANPGKRQRVFLIDVTQKDHYQAVPLQFSILQRGNPYFYSILCIGDFFPQCTQ